MLNKLSVFFKYADDSTSTAPVSSNSDPSDHLEELFLNWSRENNMICNPSKCMELVVRKKKNNTHYVYGASESDLLLFIIQRFLDRCHKHRFVSSPVPINDLFYDCKILKAISSVDNHPRGSYLPPTKENKYDLRKKQYALPKVNTERFMTSYVNRLIIKHKIR